MFIDQRYGYCNRESSTYFLPVVFLMVMAMLLSEYRSCITIWPAAANNYANVGIGTRYVVYTLRSWIILSEGGDHDHLQCNLTIWQSIFSSIQNENVWIDFVPFFSVKIDKHSGSIIQDLRVFTYSTRNPSHYSRWQLTNAMACKNENQLRTAPIKRFLCQLTFRDLTADLASWWMW